MIIKKIFNSLYYINGKHRYKKYRIKFINENKEVYLKNKQFNNCATKKRCFIIGNGPSIRDFNFKFLEDEDVFTVNQISRNENFNLLNPKYHFISDQIYFNDVNNKDLLNCTLKVIEKNAKLFVFANPKNEVIKEISKFTNNIFYMPLFMLPDEYTTYTFDLSNACPAFNNIIQTAIYFAISMGYKEIYLLGCEQTSIMNVLEGLINKSATNKYYGYFIPNGEKNRMVKFFNSISVATWLEGHAKMFKDFEWLNKQALKKDCKIFNCTKNSLCDAFEKRDFNEVIK